MFGRVWRVHLFCFFLLPFALFSDCCDKAANSAIRLTLIKCSKAKREKEGKPHLQLENECLLANFALQLGEGYGMALKDTHSG